jgi:hypothetical protein
VSKSKKQQVVKKLSKSCQKVVTKLSKSCKKLPKSCHKVDKKIVKSCQKVPMVILCVTGSHLQNSTKVVGGGGWGANSSSKAFSISFADRPKSKNTKSGNLDAGMIKFDSEWLIESF